MDIVSKLYSGGKSKQTYAVALEDYERELSTDKYSPLIHLEAVDEKSSSEVYMTTCLKDNLRKIEKVEVTVVSESGFVFKAVHSIRY